ncbi:MULTISPECIES: DUF2624 family protein [Allobacillus]|uniref:DUF2624 family protein n=1 Tax=Allobacillus salarius TaxID=1955272 RepID=A0A556PTK5_9BACI|nr:DUF2624 family protein [Allobacillus salarius]TSJ67713.1 DUF2624 family protein [Allobacillus salarius]
MIKQLVRMKLAQTSPKEIVQYSQRYNIPLTMSQSEELLDFIHTKKIDPFSEKDRLKTFSYIEQNIGRREANNAKKLLENLAKEYNLDHLL